MQRSRNIWLRAGVIAIVAAFLCAATLLSYSSAAHAQAGITFSAVAAGDASWADVILWTRVQPANATSLTAQVSTDPAFGSGLSFSGITDPTRDNIVKILATGLQPATSYVYRFVGPNGELSPVGKFRTVPRPTAAVPIHFGFSGDVDGQWRPYGSTSGFTAPGVPSFAQQNFDFFVFLGDTIYETASAISAGTADPFANPAQALVDYHRKYREQLQPVVAGGFPGLQTLFASQANYTLLDNHELGNKQFINGGAPPGSPPGQGVDATNSANDVNVTGTFINKTVGFRTLVQAYNDYQPIRERTISAPLDPRTDGTQQLYFAQQWGASTVFFNLDDRSYRDIRLKKTGNADDTGARADNPNRTMLGATELQWFEQSLLAAHQQGIVWKVVATSSPIDQIGAIGSGADGGKSWMGGYRAERNKIMKFIADNHIDHVVFLSTDDHQVRVNEVLYAPDPNAPTRYVVVPGAISIIDGPLGAGGPDTITDHSFTNSKALADSLANQQIAAGVNPIGLDPNFPGLFNVFREGDPNANKLRQPVDFYSPDTFNFASLDVSADGRTLSVAIYGINSYAANTFPEPSAANPLRKLFSFQIAASPAVTRGGFVYDRRTKKFAQQLTITNNSTSPLSGPVYVVLDSLSSNATLVNATGTTANAAPLGSPYIVVPGTVSGMAPGATATVTLQFANSTASGITYYVRTLNGPSAP